MVDQVYHAQKSIAENRKPNAAFCHTVKIA